MLTKKQIIFIVIGFILLNFLPVHYKKFINSYKGVCYDCVNSTSSFKFGFPFVVLSFNTVDGGMTGGGSYLEIFKNNIAYNFLICLAIILLILIISAKYNLKNSFKRFFLVFISILFIFFSLLKMFKVPYLTWMTILYSLGIFVVLTIFYYLLNYFGIKNFIIFFILLIVELINIWCSYRMLYHVYYWHSDIVLYFIAFVFFVLNFILGIFFFKIFFKKRNHHLLVYLSYIIMLIGTTIGAVLDIKYIFFFMGFCVFSALLLILGKFLEKRKEIYE